MNGRTQTEDLIHLEDLHGSGAHSPAPVVMVEGQGVHLLDREGNRYLDCTSGIGVAALGHAHPALVRAISEQAGRLITCASAYYHNDVRVRLQERISQITPGDLNRVFLCNSGTEAVETALKLARLSTQRAGIVAATRGYHGRTLGALAATWKLSYRKPFEPLMPGVTHISYDDAAALEEAVTPETAAVLLETIQGEGGIHPATPEFLQAARRLCDERGALLILDEVQCGMGRTGRWFACEHSGVVPDVLCLAKALGGGMPIAATAFREALSFKKGQHGSTYGGNPLACQAALAVIDTIEDSQLLDNVAQVGSYFLERLRALHQANPQKVREVRGMGLMLAVELRHKAGPVIKALMERGVLALFGGTTIVRFLPPYIFTQADVDEAVNALEAVLS
jgi:acetylornithine/LysW-gamma-L-lysine aminotransferase